MIKQTTYSHLTGHPRTQNGKGFTSEMCVDHHILAQNNASICALFKASRNKTIRITKQSHI